MSELDALKARAQEALAALALLPMSAGADSACAAAACEALAAALSPAEVEAALAPLQSPREGGDEEVEPADDDEDAQVRRLALAHSRCRWLCAHRRCPLTTPSSPF